MTFLYTKEEIEDILDDQKSIDQRIEDMRKYHQTMIGRIRNLIDDTDYENYNNLDCYEDQISLILAACYTFLEITYETQKIEGCSRLLK